MNLLALARLGLTLLIFCNFANASQSYVADKVKAQAAHLSLLAQLTQVQLPAGHWDGTFEGDPTTDALMLLLSQQLGFLDESFKRESLTAIFKSNTYKDGVWSAYPGGPASASITGTVLVALKAALGMDQNSPEVTQAWRYFQEQGGVESIHPMFKLQLVFLGALPRSNAPFLSPKFLALPKSAPASFFNIGVARTAVVPCMILSYYYELFQKGGSAKIMDSRRLSSAGSEFGNFFQWPSTLLSQSQLLGVDPMPVLYQAMKLADKFVPGDSEFWAQEALGWILATTQKDGTWAGLFQSSALNLMALEIASRMGVADFSKEIAAGYKGLLGWRRTLPNGVRFQQFSEGPIMETARVMTAMGYNSQNSPLWTRARSERAVNWVLSKQIQTPGDWSYRMPGVASGGWAYQNFNDRYPDVDDTAMVVEALIKSPQADQPRVQASIDKGTKWILAMQNKDGGFPAWEKDTPSWMHKAFETQQGMDVLVDPSESDVTARVIRALVAYKNNRGSRNFVRDVNLDSAIFVLAAF